MFIILADAELELVPEVMMGEDDIKGIMKSEGKTGIILDNYLMKNSIKKYFPTGVKRMGFPHIAYMFIRMNEESLLNSSLKIDYAIHTKQNIIIEKGDLTSLGPGYQEFRVRIGEMLEKGKRKMTLLEYMNLKGIGGNAVILHPRGKGGLVVNDQLNYVMGGFPEGDYLSDLGNLRKFSIYGKEETVPAILELLHFRLFQQLNPS